MKKIVDLTKLVDNMNLWVARALLFLLLPLVGLTLYGVIMRYVFNAPPPWGWQVLLLIFYPIALMGGGHVYSIDGHVKLDLVYSRWSVKGKRISDIATFFAFLLFTVCLAMVSINVAWDSTASNESYFGYAFKGPIWPGKVVLAIGVVLLLLQGVALFIRNVHSLITDRKMDSGKMESNMMKRENER